MIKFYLHQIDNSHEIHCNTNSTITEIAGAFDLGTMELEWNECKYAIFPNTPFFIKDTTTNEVWSFIISEDKVEIVKKTNPVKYLHRLTLSHTTHKLSNIALRNSVFANNLQSQSKLFKKRTTFVNIVDSVDGVKKAEGYAIFIQSFNEHSFLRDNYSIDLSNTAFVRSGFLELKSVLCLFEGVTWTSVHPNDYNLDGQRKRLVDKEFSFVRIDIVDADNEYSYKRIDVYGDNIFKKIPLSQDILEFLANRKVYVKVSAAQLNDLTDYLDFAPTRLPAPIIYGYIETRLTLNCARYTLYDILDIINWQCAKKYNDNHLPLTYKMLGANTEHGQVLRNTLAPELSFNGEDLYSAVVKTLSYIDAFPVLTEDGILDFQYLNDLSNEKIDVLEMSDLETTFNEENFTNRMSSVYQQAKLRTPIYHPSKYRYSRPSTSTYGITGRDNWYYFVNKNIDYIIDFNLDLQNVEISLRAAHYGDYIVYISGLRLSNYGDFTSTSDPSYNYTMSVDLSYVTFPADIYNALPEGYPESTSLNRSNALSYDRGSNRINLYGIVKKQNQNEVEQLLYAAICAWNYQMGYGWGNDTATPTDTFEIASNKSENYFNCVYYPIVDGKVAEESTTNKAEKETPATQETTSTDLNRIGNNIQGLLAKLGNETKVVSLPIVELRNRVKIGTIYTDELGRRWIVNRVKTSFTTNEDKVIVEAEFTKDFNALQSFTSIDQEKRFYTFDNAIVNKGYETINEFIYFTTNFDNDIEELAEKIAFYPSGLKTVLQKTLHDSSYNLASYNDQFDYAIIQTSDKATFITPIVYGCGNQICFEFGYDSPLLAANITVYTDNKVNTIAYLYTNDEGEENVITLSAKFSTKEVHDQYNYPMHENAFIGETIFNISDFYYYKKSNEIFHTNYSLCFMPYWVKTINELGIPLYQYEEIYFGDKFTNANAIIPGADVGTSLTFWVSDEPYSIIDNQAHGTKLTGTISVSVSINQKDGSSSTGYSSYGTIVAKQNGSNINVANYKSWCIADEYGNVYIAVNKGENSSNIAMLGWFTSRFRKV